MRLNSLSVEVVVWMIGCISYFSSKRISKRIDDYSVCMGCVCEEIVNINLLVENIKYSLKIQIKIELSCLLF